MSQTGLTFPYALFDRELFLTVTYCRAFLRHAGVLGHLSELFSLARMGRYLVQGTLYPDVIESCPPPGSGQKHSHTIKSHHNVGGLPKDLKFTLIEPLRELFKARLLEYDRCCSGAGNKAANKSSSQHSRWHGASSHCLLRSAPPSHVIALLQWFGATLVMAQKALLLSHDGPSQHSPLKAKVEALRCLRQLLSYLWL